jgi:Lon protease-like protein
MQTAYELPLFPLNLTLLPGGVIALKIFEVRYLDLMKRCLKEDQPFGVVALTQGGDTHQPGEPSTQFHRHGTLAQIIEFEVVQPALFFVRCLGTKRFELQNPELRAMGLWHATIQEIEPDPFYPIPPKLQKVADQLERQIQIARDKGIRPEQMPFAEPYQFHDCGWVANRWCDLLDLSANEKDVLMMQENPKLRLELLTEILIDSGIVGADES